MKEQVHLALGTPQKFVQLGNFCVKVRDQSMNVYYNMDLGNSKTKVFDLSSGTYKNMETAHRSFHSSGHSHMKEEEGGKKLFKGEICDGSPMNDPDKTLLILGVESLHFDVAPLGNAAYDPSTVFLSPPNGINRYSILWLWAPATDKKTMHPRHFYGNFIDDKRNTFQTGELGDLAITLETTTVLAINGWEIRALFLQSLLPLANHNILLNHPKGIDQAWRSHVFVDSHLPLSAMLRLAAQKKKPLQLPAPYHIAPEARSPMAWAKQKKRRG
jgi:hypothetical protein